MQDTNPSEKPSHLFSQHIQIQHDQDYKDDKKTKTQYNKSLQIHQTAAKSGFLGDQASVTTIKCDIPTGCL